MTDDEESWYLLEITNAGILRFAQNDSAKSFFNKLLGACVARRRGRFQSLQNGVEHQALRHRAFDSSRAVDDRARHGVDAVFCGEVGEFRGFDAIGRDEVVLHRKTVSQAHGLRAVRSGGGDENFQVQR